MERFRAGNAGQQRSGADENRVLEARNLRPSEHWPLLSRLLLVRLLLQRLRLASARSWRGLRVRRKAEGPSFSDPQAVVTPRSGKRR